MGPKPHVPIAMVAREPRAGRQQSFAHPLPPRLWYQQEQAQLGGVLPLGNTEYAAQPLCPAHGDPTALAGRVMVRDEVIENLGNKLSKARIKPFIPRIEIGVLAQQPPGI